MTKIIRFGFKGENAEELVEFYEKTFNWKFERQSCENNLSDSWMLKSDSKEKQNSDNTQAVISIDIKNIDETIKRITENGGRVFIPVTSAQDFGAFIYFYDKMGNRFAIKLQGNI